MFINYTGFYVLPTEIVPLLYPCPILIFIPSGNTFWTQIEFPRINVLLQATQIFLLYGGNKPNLDWVQVFKLLGLGRIHKFLLHVE